MRDVVYILITLAFFAICVGLIQACNAVIGADELDELDTGVAGSSEPEVASGVTS